MIILQNLNWLAKTASQESTQESETSPLPSVYPAPESSENKLIWKFKKTLSEDFSYTLVFTPPVALSKVTFNGKDLATPNNRHCRSELKLDGLCEDNTITIEAPEDPANLGPAFIRVQKKGKPDGEEIKMGNNVLPVDFILRDVSYDISLNENLSLAEITPSITVESNTTMSLWVKMDIDGHELLSSQRVFVEKGTSTHKIKSVKIGRPHLWNPVGKGSVSTYRADLHLAQGEALIIDSCNIGIRTLKESSDSSKEKTVLEINGEKIECKATALPDELDQLSAEISKIDAFIQDAQQKGFNTLRLTGNNSYGNNVIFALCDKAGMMVQQDFPSGGRNIEDKKELAESVKHEIPENLNRLNTHPSFTIFSGSKEAAELAPDNIIVSI